MPRLKNKVTGVVVNVDDELAGKLDTNWVPADQPRRRTRKAAADTEVEDASGHDHD